MLDHVDFRQLSDDEEVLSDEDDEHTLSEDAGARRSSQGEDVAAMARPRVPDHHIPDISEFDTIDLQRIRQSTARSNWRRIPSEVGVEGCQGCHRLCSENKRLRRQLDELEFELASGVLHNPSDGFDPPNMVKAVPAIPQIPIMSKKKKGWTSKLRNSTAVSMSASRPNEKSRLKSEVRALTVTTEYLWRKLNKAEIELRNYRVKELRDRMRLNSSKSMTEDRRLGSASAHLRGADWEWEV